MNYFINPYQMPGFLPIVPQYIVLPNNNSFPQVPYIYPGAPPINQINEKKPEISQEEPKNSSLETKEKQGKELLDALDSFENNSERKTKKKQENEEKNTNFLQIEQETKENLPLQQEIKPLQEVWKFYIKLSLFKHFQGKGRKVAAFQTNTRENRNVPGFESGKLDFLLTSVFFLDFRQIICCQNNFFVRLFVLEHKYRIDNLFFRCMWLENHADFSFFLRS